MSLRWVRDWPSTSHPGTVVAGNASSLVISFATSVTVPLALSDLGYGCFSLFRMNSSATISTRIPPWICILYFKWPLDCAWQNCPVETLSLVGPDLISQASWIPHLQLGCLGFKDALRWRWELELALRSVCIFFFCLVMNKYIYLVLINKKIQLEI